MKKTIIGFSLAGLLLAGGDATTSFAADTETSAEKGELSWNLKTRGLDIMAGGLLMTLNLSFKGLKSSALKQKEKMPKL